jgi:anti-anti-sigma factor
MVSEESGVFHLSAEGEARTQDFPVGGPGHFEQILGATWATRRVLLDMERVAYLDSSAIGWLITSQKAFRSSGGYLAMHSLQPQVKNLLNLLKLDRVVPIADGAEAGLEAMPAAKRGRKKATV